MNERFNLLAEAPADCRNVDPDDMPEPYRGLLVHTNHMTVTVEDFFQSKVDVQVLASKHDGDHYFRRILLRMPEGPAVQFGAVVIDLTTLPNAVRSRILAEDTPLGRVLIENNVLTRVEPLQYLTMTADAEFAVLFGCGIGTKLYGRLGMIFAGEKPAIEVLEMLAPVALSDACASN
jgi:chorismate-pyruvate lyase